MGEEGGEGEGRGEGEGIEGEGEGRISEEVWGIVWRVVGEGEERGRLEGGVMWGGDKKEGRE